MERMPELERKDAVPPVRSRLLCMVTESIAGNVYHVPIDGTPEPDNDPVMTTEEKVPS